jgi:hypothetical protein
MEEMVQQHLLEPPDVELDELNDGNGKPKDGVLPEEGYGGAPESFHWAGCGPGEE